MTVLTTRVIRVRVRTEIAVGQVSCRYNAYSIQSTLASSIRQCLASAAFSVLATVIVMKKCIFSRAIGVILWSSKLSMAHRSVTAFYSVVMNDLLIRWRHACCWGAGRVGWGTFSPPATPLRTRQVAPAPGTANSSIFHIFFHSRWQCSAGLPATASYAVHLFPSAVYIAPQVHCGPNSVYGQHPVSTNKTPLCAAPSSNTLRGALGLHCVPAGKLRCSSLLWLAVRGSLSHSSAFPR